MKKEKMNFGKKIKTNDWWPIKSNTKLIVFILFFAIPLFYQYKTYKSIIIDKKEECSTYHNKWEVKKSVQFNIIDKVGEIRSDGKSSYRHLSLVCKRPGLSYYYVFDVDEVDFARFNKGDNIYYKMSEHGTIGYAKRGREQLEELCEKDDPRTGHWFMIAGVPIIAVIFWFFIFGLFMSDEEGIGPDIFKKDKGWKLYCGRLFFRLLFWVYPAISFYIFIQWISLE